MLYRVQASTHHEGGQYRWSVQQPTFFVEAHNPDEAVRQAQHILRASSGTVIAVDNDGSDDTYRHWERCL